MGQPSPSPPPLTPPENTGERKIRSYPFSLDAAQAFTCDEVRPHQEIHGPQLVWNQHTHSLPNILDDIRNCPPWLASLVNDP